MLSLPLFAGMFVVNGNNDKNVKNVNIHTVYSVKQTSGLTNDNDDSLPANVTSVLNPNSQSKNTDTKNHHINMILIAVLIITFILSILTNQQNSYN
jgi:predicted MPP superfamily phosphohydrolase